MSIDRTGKVGAATLDYGETWKEELGIASTRAWPNQNTESRILRLWIDVEKRLT